VPEHKPLIVQQLKVIDGSQHSYWLFGFGIAK
jgi:hypothetical protein